MAAPAAAPPAGSVATVVDEFTRALKRLACAVAASDPADATLARAQKRVTLAVVAGPIAVVDVVGATLYRYRDEIYADDHEFFLGTDFAAEASARGEAEAAQALQVIGKVKAAWRKAAPPARAGYTRAVQGLLDTYLDYLVLTGAAG